MSIDQLGDLDFRGKRVTVVGLGVEGVDVTRYLARHGTLVTVSDTKPAEALSEHIKEIADLPVRLSLGGNDPKEIESADAIFISQGVPLDLPSLAKARQRGTPLHSMLTLFMALCPGPIVGITGSSGKTTTTALLGEMFQADERPVFVGGNIGVGLLEQLPTVRTYTWSVLEMSHTQLQLAKASPHVAAILNITPNHLDRFSWDEYRRLKGSLLRFQGGEDIAVLSFDDAEAKALADSVKGHQFWFSQGPTIPANGVLVREGWAILRQDQREEPLFSLESIPLRGLHNQANALAAAALAAACGVSPEAMACAIASFQGVPHRLELVAEADGIRYYNDSIATTPERTLAGIRSFEEPLVLLLGGRDKHLPLEKLAREATRRCRAIVLFGESAGKLEKTLRALPAQGRAPLIRVADLPQAVEAAHTAAQPGDVVLLSPSGTSFDAYESFERRGEHFRSLLRQFVQEVAPSLP